MTIKKRDIDDMLMAIVQIIEEGGILSVCDMNLNVLSHPVVLDGLSLSKINREKDPPDFWMAWRPMGITAKFESGAFNVEEAVYAHIIDFKLEEDQICFTRKKENDETDMIVVTPLTEEYRGEWEEWSRFKMSNRDVFEDIEMSLAHILNEKEAEARSKEK